MIDVSVLYCPGIAKNPPKISGITRNHQANLWRGPLPAFLFSYSLPDNNVTRFARTTVAGLFDSGGAKPIATSEMSCDGVFSSLTG
jgi:hypothetical protein